MWRALVSLLLATVIALPQAVEARSDGYGLHARSHHSHATRHATHNATRSATHHASHTGKSSRAVPGVARDKNGKIKRSERAKDRFKHAHPCPATGKSRGPCPGYVIDHVTALKRGGADAPDNMQWQTKQAAKQKDKWE